MKKSALLLLVLIFLVDTFCFSQQSEDATIRSIEDSEREAILKSDTVMLQKLFSAHAVVHNPENKIVTFRQMIERVKSGKIEYASFERIIDHISFVENIAIVMGKEVIIPKGMTENAGKTVRRSFTNIWMKTQAGWKLTARQATIISVE